MTNWMDSRGVSTEAGASANAAKLMSEKAMKMTRPTIHWRLLCGLKSVAAFSTPLAIAIAFCSSSFMMPAACRF